MRRALLIASLVASAPAAAQLQFSPFEARSVAMGGAAVALPGDGGAFLDNPALLGQSHLASTLSVGGVGTESGDFLGRLDTLSGTDPAAAVSSPARLAEILSSLKTLGETGNGILGTGRVGPAVTSQSWGVALTDQLWGGAFVRPDLVHVALGTDPSTSIAFNDSRAAFRGLSLRDLALAHSATVGRFFTFGLTAHVLRGTTSSKEESVYTTDVSDPYRLARRALSGAERTRTHFTWDAGALVSLGPVRFGGVLKAINRPSFPFADDAPAADRGTGLRYGRQARVGASAKIPVVGLTAALDLDLTKNETTVPGLRSREVGGGLEARLGLFAFRGGVGVNLESPDKTRVFSFGFGVSAKVVKADAAVVYRPGKSALGAVLSIHAGI
ncbi:MAG TPA: conjugal transfer protein TraF [Thermoanaerobaculia bacterium]|nr:conjugal transfer protein TraF [Thermoanaerobaculia bacterium]